MRAYACDVVAPVPAPEGSTNVFAPRGEVIDANIDLPAAPIGGSSTTVGDNSGGSYGGDQKDGGGAHADVAGTAGNGLGMNMTIVGGGTRDVDMSAAPMGSYSFIGNVMVLVDATVVSGSLKDGDLKVMADPIDLSRADKSHIQVDYLSAGAAPLRMGRVYHSNPAVNTAHVTVPMGAGWHMFYDRSLQTLSPTQVRLHRANGQTLDYTWNGSAWVSTLPGGVLGAVSGGWQYVNNRNTVESYDTSGRLLNMSDGGLVTTLHYDTSGRLASVLNPFGRSLSFGWDGAGRIASVTLPDGSSSLLYAYGSANKLSSITFTDGSVRSYVYENSSFPNALTGIIDESGRRRLSWSYDAAGRPNGGYFGAGMDAVSAVYSADGNTVTTSDARGTQRTRSFATINGRRVLTQLQTAATADSAATTLSFTFDASGNQLSSTTASGEVQQFAYDARGRTTALTRAAGTPQALTLQTAWHPLWRIPVQTIAAGVTNDISIDSVGRIAAITRSAGGYTQTLSTRSYNAQNLLQSSVDARGTTTSYTYDAAGNRTSVTDGLGHTTWLRNYDANGQAGEIDRPDGTVVLRSFDARGRLKTRSVAGHTMSYTTDGSGRVTRAASSTGSWRAIAYDAAGMPQSITNDRGETRLVTRDATGAATARQVYNASGALALAASRQLNGVGHVKALLDANGNATRLNYASDGRLSSVTDAVNINRSLTLDVLSRPVSVTVPNTSAMQAAGGPASVSISHSWDNQARHSSTIDTAVVPTSYGYNAFNQRISEASNDAGNRQATRNAAGDVTSFTDAMGTAFSLSHDSLGRLTAVSAGGLTHAYTYVANDGSSRLAGMSDDGTSAWSYDSAGRMLTQQQSIYGLQRNVSITRDALGRPLSVTYPSGMVLSISYNKDVVASLSLKPAGAATPSTLLAAISYAPFSQQPTGWHWGNGSSYSRSFDANGRVSSVSLGTHQRSYTYDAAGRMQSQADVFPGGSASASYAYDEAGQLIRYLPSAGIAQSFSYDTNGNRLSDSIYGVTHTYSINTNRLVAINSTRSYAYNADGTPQGNGELVYGYDAFGRLATTFNASLNVGYGINGLGQRYAKMVTRNYGCGLPEALPRAGRGGSAKGTSTGASTSASTSTGNSGAGPTPMTHRPPPCNPWIKTNLVRYVYDDAGHLIGEYDSITGASQETVWFAGQPVATVQGGQLYYISADNLGTPRSIVRASDNVELWRWDSDPFGTSLPTNPNPAQGSLSYNLRFPGQVYDTETGTNYNGMRDYNPWTGRYLEPDPIGLGGGLSRYGYAGGDPLDRADASGLVSAVFQVGGSYGRGPAAEGYVGLYLTVPWPGTNVDFGVYGSGGIGGGWSSGFGWGLGAVRGDQTNISGISYNLNASLSPVSATLMFDKEGLVGGVIGPADEFGSTGTRAQTGAIGLSDFGHWLGSWLFDKFGSCPSGH